jgi:hypothetical protein
MSAIQRDREIAAKASRGEWVLSEPSTKDWTPRNRWQILHATDADHIVRLHNRQPLYDALVDAARAYFTAHEGKCGGGVVGYHEEQRDYKTGRITQEGQYEYCECAHMIGALAALDKEEP